MPRRTTDRKMLLSTLPRSVDDAKSLVTLRCDLALIPHVCRTGVSSVFRFQAADVDPPVVDTVMMVEESMEATENHNDATPATTEVSARRVLFKHGKVRVSRAASNCKLTSSFIACVCASFVFFSACSPDIVRRRNRGRCGPDTGASVRSTWSHSSGITGRSAHSTSTSTRISPATRPAAAGHRTRSAGGTANTPAASASC